MRMKITMKIDVICGGLSIHKQHGTGAFGVARHKST
jgi:hypothetical protein